MGPPRSVGPVIMNQYELLYIVSNQFTDAEIEKISKQVADEVTNAGGTVLSSRPIGKIRLAYPIKKQRHGTYVLVHFDAESSVVEVLNRKFGLTEEMLRHTMTTRRPGAENDVYELTSYVAPLSEEARRERQKDHGEDAPRSGKPRHAEEELPPPPPSATSAQEKSMSMEELDKKLDELLDEDVTENI